MLRAGASIPSCPKAGSIPLAPALDLIEVESTINDPMAVVLAGLALALALAGGEGIDGGCWSPMWRSSVPVFAAVGQEHMLDGHFSYRRQALASPSCSWATALDRGDAGGAGQSPGAGCWSSSRAATAVAR